MTDKNREEGTVQSSLPHPGEILHPAPPFQRLMPDAEIKGLSASSGRPHRGVAMGINGQDSEVNLHGLFVQALWTVLSGKRKETRG